VVVFAVIATLNLYTQHLDVEQRLKEAIEIVKQEIPNEENVDSVARPISVAEICDGGRNVGSI
jgi:hypothetical protein